MELRTSGHYAEALAVFKQMETVKRTPSSRKNIQWLEKQLANPGDEIISNKSDKKWTKASQTKDLMNQLGDDNKPTSGSLDDLFLLMEP